MTALGTCQRKTRMTSATMASSSMSVCFRFSIERRISSDRSYTVTTFTPWGSDGSSSFSFALTRSMTVKRVLARPDHDDAGDRVASAVEVGDAAADIGPERDLADIAHPHRRAALRAREHDAADLIRGVVA